MKEKIIFNNIYNRIIESNEKAFLGEWDSRRCKFELGTICIFLNICSNISP